jgi:hypothetical protein
VRPVALDSGKYLVFLVRVSEFISIILCRAHYRSEISWKGQKPDKLWRSYHKFHLAHPILIRTMEFQRRNIGELQKGKFHTQKGRNFGDIAEERLSRRTMSKSRFKSDTWPTCHPKRELIH